MPKLCYRCKTLLITWELFYQRTLISTMNERIASEIAFHFKCYEKRFMEMRKKSNEH